jgi:hypothetical protein
LRLASDLKRLTEDSPPVSARIACSAQMARNSVVECQALPPGSLPPWALPCRE